MNMLEVKVEGLALDMTTNSPVVILAAEGVDKVLPIWIGHAEAWGIAMELSGIKSARPMTYDLIRNIIETLQANLDRVEITELREQTFFARLLISNKDQKYEVDARPSDSIALALKSKAGIFVNEQLFQLKEGEPGHSPNMATDPETLRERLRKINPEDFGKYPL